MASPPGAVPDNDNYSGTPLTIAKSGTNLTLNRSAPGVTCSSDNYSIYRGTLPWSDYNHVSSLCSTGGATSYSLPMDTDSYYYLVVAQNDALEGSYGLDSADQQRPAAADPILRIPLNLYRFAPLTNNNTVFLLSMNFLDNGSATS